MPHVRFIKPTRTQGGATLLFIGLVALAYVGYAVTQLMSAADWSSTSGTITSSGFEQRGYSVGHGRRGHRLTHRKYRPIVRYRYVVAGIEYTGSRVYFGDVGLTSSSLLSMDLSGKLDRYPEGASVSVFYDAETPSNAVLEKTLSWTAYAAIFLGMASTIFGAAGLLSKQEPKASSPASEPVESYEHA